MKNWTAIALIVALGISSPVFAQEIHDAAPPPVPTHVAAKDAVKTYMLDVIERANTACQALAKDSREYQKLCEAHGNDPAAAAKAEPAKMAELIGQMREDYKGIHNYGYEYVEGIVAGIPSLIKYDVELDSGVPRKGASVTDAVADIHITAPGVDVDHEGSVNSYLIEAAVYGTDAKWTQGEATLPGFDKPVKLPRPALIVAFADYAVGGYARLLKDTKAWQPTDRDFFQAIYTMTPTLSDYFDDWKEARKYGSASGGRFVGVSRVSDMKGILGSTQLAWESIANRVHAKDPALADKITLGYVQIMKFIQTIYDRDQAHPLKIETIDALGSQAKEKADRLTVQVAQAAALVGEDVNGK